ncbi:hypothetical protein MUY35_05230 [Aliiroseovarius sp. S1339]|nr:hypothetical protein [Aliiroseovarius sp. S1339]MCK8463249.1 hypothetical protein [Aliiroseovarius sp. S1339]
MLRTIVLGSCVMVQGQYVRDLSDGRIVVRVEDRLFSGHPVKQRKAA